MSAFIVEDYVINTIVTFIHNHNRGRDKDYYYILNPLRSKGFLAHTPAVLGKMLFDLNCKAVDARYGAGDNAGETYTYKPMPHNNIYQVLKYIDCLIYQCSEGDIPETSDLYDAINQLSGEIAHKLVEAMPQYQQADWS